MSNACLNSGGVEATFFPNSEMISKITKQRICSSIQNKFIQETSRKVTLKLILLNNV